MNAVLRYFEDLVPGHSERIPATYALSEQDIIAYAREWDPQPFHVDPEYARTMPQQGLTASSAHLYAIAARLLNQVAPPIAGIASLKHEMHIPNPARPGDSLSLRISIVEACVSSSKPDRGLVTIDSLLSTETEVPVLELRSLMMIRRRPG